MHFRNKHVFEPAIQGVLYPCRYQWELRTFSILGERAHLKQMEIVVLIYTNTDVGGEVLYRFKTSLQIVMVKTLQGSFCKLCEVSTLP